MREFTGFKKGINFGGWLSQCSGKDEHYREFISENDVKAVSLWGIDHVRLPVDYCLVEDEDGAENENGYKYIDSCIAWCEKYGLNMVLDLHKTAGFSFDDSSTVSSFFNSEELRSRFTRLWVKLARRYGKFSGFVAFELLNEVVLYDTADQWNKLLYKTVSAIRAVAPDVKIIVGGVCFNSTFTVALLDAPYDGNIVYNFHCYEPLLFTHQRAYWIENMPADLRTQYPDIADAYTGSTDCLTKELSLGVEKLGVQFYIENAGRKLFETLFADAVRVAGERNVPLYCGEYGVIDRAPVEGTLNWYADINAVFEKYGIGRAAWTYKSMDFGLIGTHYEPIFKDLLKLL
ncbi:MAG: glycoside hydrolase family 5 protein [Oscillospiraceae bacterium]|jgi:aryl-phospho-beta-D-glucosidase BglC (GH1 family)|nr:glycoside hydrolase family 5 protein [Oscillospiraceae bacterium]